MCSVCSGYPEPVAELIYDQDDVDYYVAEAREEEQEKAAANPAIPLKKIMEKLIDLDATVLDNILVAIEELTAPEPEPTEIRHTFWGAGKIDDNGLFVYTVTHNLHTYDWKVEVEGVDSQLWQAIASSEDRVVINSRADLGGLEITVKKVEL